MLGSNYLQTSQTLSWSPVMCYRVVLSRLTQSAQLPQANVPLCCKNELWASPMPPASPPVLCSHKVLHYHRACRENHSRVECSGEDSLLWQRKGRLDLWWPNTARLLVWSRGSRVYLISPFSNSSGTNTQPHHPGLVMSLCFSLFMFLKSKLSPSSA